MNINQIVKKAIIPIVLFLCFPKAYGQLIFRHIPDGNNTSGHVTTIDNYSTNNNPNVILIVSPVWQGAYNAHPSGVWFNGSKWTIFNEDFAAMPNNAQYFVYSLQQSERVFVHQANGQNTSSNWTVLNHPQLNANPNAKLLVTQRWDNNTRVYNPHSVGIWYNGNAWTIFNQDRSPMPMNAEFNIMIDDQIFVAESYPGNTSGHIVNTGRTETGANVFITQYWTSVYNNHEVGAWVNGNQWSIFNQDMGAMAGGTKFMVLIR